MSLNEENVDQSEDSLVENVIEAIRNVKKKHSGQYLENVARECEKSFGWDRPTTTTALQHATERNLIRPIQVDKKILYRENDEKSKKVCIRDNVNTAATQTDNKHMQNTIETLTSEFIDFKRHVCGELEAIKRKQNTGNIEADAAVGINYEKALIKSLENRIVSLERLVQQKQEIIDRQLSEKQKIIEKLLINNNIQAQAQLRPIKNNEEQLTQKKQSDAVQNNQEQSKQKKQSDAKTTNKDKREPEREEENKERPKAKNPANKEDAPTVVNETTQASREKPSKKSILLTGDSLLNGISENGLRSKHNVKCRPHSGASSQDMIDFIKPYLRKKPDAIILHCGTNDLTKGVNTIESLEKIVQTAKTESEWTELVISGLVTRRDKPGMIKKVADLNSRVKDFCRNQQIKFLDNSNLNDACLAAKKLHLNKRGNSYLANNFLKVISEL